jgi:acyl carrier protein
MERAEMLVSINKIFIDILDNDTIIVTEESFADDIEEWDSLTHIQLVVAVEKYFKIRFTSKEIQSWKNVGEMITCIQNK